MIILITLLGLILLVLFISRREQVPAELGKKGIALWFYRAGAFIYRRLFEARDKQSPYLQKIYDANLALNPAGKTGKETAVFFIKKLGLCLLLLTAGFIIAAVLTVKEKGESIFVSENRVERESYEGEEYTITLDAEIDGQVFEDMEIEVGRQQYTTQQLEEMLPEFYEALEKDFLGENESVDFITRPVNFVKKVEGYPFQLSYTRSDKASISYSGEIGEDVPETGLVNLITVTLKYGDFETEYEFGINVFPRDYTKTEYLTRILENALTEKNNETATEDYLELPGEAEGISVIWKEKKKNNTWIFILMFVISALAVFVGADKDLFSKVEKRNEQMLEDYPEIVSKLTLFIGAGMSVRGAWKKTVMDYRKNAGANRRYAYEEMLFTLYEMENGTEETVCYSHFSQRIRVQKYVKLISILDQNSRKGSKNLIEVLRAESRDAFEERKSLAERKGETAGTKLLLPMMLMLMVVMVIIMVPAFMSM